MSAAARIDRPTTAIGGLCIVNGVIQATLAVVAASHGDAAMATTLAIIAAAFTALGLLGIVLGTRR